MQMSTDKRTYAARWVNYYEHTKAIDYREKSELVENLKFLNE
jgi:hypothetical protein